MASKNDDYQTLSQALDEVVVKLQSGDVAVDEATALYEQGMELVQKLDQHLKTAKNKVIKIKARFDIKD